jgi:hypothetical protein
MVVVAVLMLSSCRTLGPGETQCTTSDVFGTAVTNCKSGPSHPVEVQHQGMPVYYPPAPPPNYVYWCAGWLGDTDIGACRIQAGECEVMRQKIGAEKMTQCAALDRVFCSPVGCYPTLRGCVASEQSAKRNGAACAYQD